MSVEPPPPSPEQLADWQGLVERIRQGGRSEVVAWDEVAAARSAGTYQVLVPRQATFALLMMVLSRLSWALRFRQAM
jgi:transposase